MFERTAKQVCYRYLDDEAQTLFVGRDRAGKNRSTTQPHCELKFARLSGKKFGTDHHGFYAIPESLNKTSLTARGFFCFYDSFDI